MRAVLAISAVALMASPAIGATYCNDDVPYFLTEVPHGYALVHVGYSDFCRSDPLDDSDFLICNGREDYRLKFVETADGLSINNSDGVLAEMRKCDADLSEYLGVHASAQ